jgi:hypothetical protein
MAAVKSHPLTSVRLGLPGHLAFWLVSASAADLGYRLALAPFSLWPFLRFLMARRRRRIQESTQTGWNLSNLRRQDGTRT